MMPCNKRGRHSGCYCKHEDMETTICWTGCNGMLELTIRKPLLLVMRPKLASAKRSTAAKAASSPKS